MTDEKINLCGKLVSLDDAVRAMYPVLRMQMNDEAVKLTGTSLPATFDDCDEADKEHLRGLVKGAVKL